MTDSVKRPPHFGPRHAWLAAMVVVVAFAAATWPVILSGNLSGRGAFDQINYHELVIREFAAAWPRFDFSDYLSATTPGYHLALAAVARFITDSRVGLQLTGSLFSFGLLATIAAWCARRAGWVMGVACTLPLALSMYVHGAGVWLLPDNIGWWGVAGVLMIALRPRIDWRFLAFGGLTLVALVFVRQSHLWAAGVLWAAAWLGESGRDGQSSKGIRLFSDVPSRAGRAAAAVAASVPAMLVVAWFARQWEGLTPPAFQGDYTGVSPCAPAFILSILACASVPFGASIARPLWGIWRERPWVLVAAAVAGLVLAAVPVTTYSIAEGRYSGLWNLVKAAPVLGGRTSVVYLALAPAGAVALVGWAAALGERERWLWLAAFAGFTAAQAASPMIWQRYSEPFVLMACAMMACQAPAERGVWRVLRLAGPLALAAALGALTAVTVVRAAPAQRMEHVPKAKTAAVSEPAARW